MSDETKKCPYCGETIMAIAEKCRYCGEWLDEKEKPAPLSTSMQAVSHPNPRMHKAIDNISARLREEAAPFATGETKMWQERIGEKVTFGETFGQALKAAMPLMKGQLRVDHLLVHDIPTSSGLLHAVMPFSGFYALPTEFLMLVGGRIPNSVYLKRSVLGSWGFGSWESKIGNENENDPFCNFLKDYRAKVDKPGKKGGTQEVDLKTDLEWDLDLGNGKVKLEWALQLFPISLDRNVFILKIPQHSEKTGKGFLGYQIVFGVRFFLEKHRMIQDAISQYAFKGPSAAMDIPVPTISLLSLKHIT